MLRKTGGTAEVLDRPEELKATMLLDTVGEELEQYTPPPETAPFPTIVLPEMAGEEELQ